MQRVIVVTELRLLPPNERWGKLLAPLAEQLSESGFGQILDFEALRRQTAELGYCPVEEVAVELADWGGYGREIVEGAIAAAGVVPGMPDVPARWRSYHCEDYYSKGWAQRGHFDEASWTQVVVPLAEVYEDVEHEFLIIGRTGCDGIDFGYRKGHSGLWAFPIDGEFKFMAETIGELVEGWCSGRLSV